MTARKQPAARPASLAGKRPAQVVGRPSPAAEDGSDLDALEAAEVDDGAVVVTLVTEGGEAAIRVPAFGTWRSRARNALMTRGDDLAWAAGTLSTADAQTWMDLDPTKSESDAFFEAWGKLAGVAMGQAQANRADRRAQRR